MQNVGRYNLYLDGLSRDIVKQVAESSGKSFSEVVREALLLMAIQKNLPIELTKLLPGRPERHTGKILRGKLRK